MHETLQVPISLLLILLCENGLTNLIYAFYSFYKNELYVTLLMFVGTYNLTFLTELGLKNFVDSQNNSLKYEK